MDLTEEMQRGSITRGLKNDYIPTLMKHFIDTACVSHSDFYNWVNLILEYRFQMGATFSSLGPTKVLFVTSDDP